MKKRFSNSLIVYVILIGACIFLFTSWPTSRGAVIYMAGEAAVFAPTDNRIAFVGWQGVQIWDETTGVFTILTDHPRLWRSGAGWPVPLAWHPSGTSIALPGEHYQIEIWDVQQHKLRTILTGPTDIVTAVAFSPDGSLLAAQGLDRQIRVWKWQDETLLWQQNGDPNTTLVFSNTGDRIITGAQVYWTNNGSVALNYYDIGNFSISCLTFQPEQELIAAGGYRGEITIADLKQHAVQQTFHMLDGAVGAVAFSPDGRLLAAGNGAFDGSNLSNTAIQVINRENGQNVWRLPRDRIFKVQQVQFSADGRRLVAVVKDTLLTIPYRTTVYIWDTSTW